MNGHRYAEILIPLALIGLLIYAPVGCVAKQMGWMP